MNKLALVAFLLPVTVFAQQGYADSLDCFIGKQVTDFKIPGLAIGIIKDGKVLFKKGYGINNTMDSLPVSTQTLFPILSCTKAFTAAAIGILVDRKKLHWNDRVIEHLPEFKLSDPQITNELTISDILSHRSGLETFEGDLLWYGTDYSRQEVVKRIRYSPIRNKFRSQFGYQNVMYLVAGLIIEKVSGQRWDDFIENEILLPLSMQRTSTSTTAFVREKNYAHPHIQNKPIPLINMDNIAPAGAVNSTVDDLLQWLQVWMNAGKPLLADSTYQSITSEKIKVATNAKEGYGYGWFVEKNDSAKILSHGGGMPGYKSFIIVIPERKIGVIVLTNTISYINEQIAGVITDYLLEKKINWQQADQLYGETFRFSWDEPHDTSYSANIPDWSRYTGVYEDTAYGKALIRVKNDSVFLTLLPAKQLFTGPLYYLNKDTLQIVFKDPFVPAGQVIFYEGNGEKAEGFRLNIESSDFHFRYLNFIRTEE